jgi:hypothetical protein
VPFRIAAVLLALAATATAAHPLRAQHHAPPILGLQALPAWERADPVPGGGSLAELRVLQPVAMLHAAPLGGRITIDGMLNLEGLTLEDGQLAPGNWGEGFVDRRHPHTYLHELVVAAPDLLRSRGRGYAVSLAAGKGFAPFGTDDPMARPGVRYPINHHYAQLLERLVAIGALQAGPLVLEVGLFNGDEPENPEQWPLASRFGDSWATRITVLPAPGFEIQTSYAQVKSPEHRPGQGLDQRKWSASARAERPFRSGTLYGLAEWARTREGSGFFAFSSVLGEAAWSAGAHRAWYRVERTERPEELRTLDPFRTVRPHTDNSILATTRWTVHTAGYGVELMPAASAFRIAPVVEASFGRVRSETPVSFDPAAFYGRDSFWSLSMGVRLGWGARLHRMGRYGAARPATAHPTPGDPGHSIQ